MENTRGEQSKWRSFLGTVILFGLVSIMAGGIVAPPDPFTMAIVTALFFAISVVAAFVIIYILEFDILPRIDSSMGWAVLESERDGSNIRVTHDLVTGGTSLTIDDEQVGYTSKIGGLMLAYIIIALVSGLVLGAWYGP